MEDPHAQPPSVPAPGVAVPPLPPSTAFQPPALMPVVPPGYPCPPGMMPVVSQDDKSMAALCHLLAILTGFLGPLIIWLVKKDSSHFVNHHGREALNFQITMFLVMMALFAVTFVLMFLVVGFLLVPFLIVLPIGMIVLEVMAGIAASRGEWHRYPFCLRLV